ncbi:MAG: S8 family serine peptidase [Gemmatimonadaceae bacterium]|nr:S8 family serine peptidase [Gemmatimonadaceae bacterium]
MLLGLWGTTALWCLGCQLADGAPTRVLVPPPEPLVNQQLTDGCTRFALKVVNGVAQVEALYNTNGCQTDQLQLLADSAPTFDVAAGTLRVPIVLKNVGSVAVMAPARIRFNADSSQFLNAQGQVMPGTPNILATNYDTASANGRSGQWRYDTLLAPSGQGQVLAPGATSRRRWLEFAGSDWSQIVRIKVPTMATQVGGVPALAPDSFPALLGSLTRLADASGDTLLEQVVIVLFKPGTSQAIRQAIVDSVGGIVVGGRRAFGADGWYFVRVPSAVTPTAIYQIVLQLSASSSVDMAIPFWRDHQTENAHIRPNDSSTLWSSASWTPSRAMAAGANWYLERISAPLAWGCSIGDASVRISVLDRGFRLGSQLLSTELAGIAFRGEVDSLFPGSQHGAMVTSALAAVGDNQTGIAGVVWKRTLDLRNISLDATTYSAVPLPDPSQLFPQLALTAEHFVRAAAAGAGVINFSQARSISVVPDTVGSTNASLRERMRYRTYDGVIKTYLSQTPVSARALIVLAAGNSLVDATFAGYPRAKAFAPNEIVVMGASSSSDQLSVAPPGTPGGSNFGALVDIFAPGDNVAVLDPDNIVTSESGTSFAAALVSGAAVLAKSFDRTMTAAELKIALTIGARQSLTYAGVTRPILDAYGTLKFTAQRQGAPLCGNPLAYVASYDSSAYTTTMSVDVKRGSGSGSTERITQFTIPGLNAVPVYVPHGGREVLVDLLDLQGLRRVAQHNGTSWQTLSQPWQVVNNPDLSGTSWSSRGWSHDGDTALWAGVTYNAGFLTSNASFSLWTNGTQGPAITTFANLPAQWTNPISGIGPYGNGAAAGGVLSPTGDFAIGVVTDGSAVTQYTFYRIAIPSGTRTMLFADNVPQLPQFSPPPWAGTFPLLQLGVAEDGSEFWYTSPAQLVGNSTCIVKRYSLVLGAFTAIDSLPGNGTLLGCTAGTGAAPGGAARVAGMGFSR